MPFFCRSRRFRIKVSLKVNIQLKEKYISVIIILVAIGASVLVFYFRGWRGWGPSVSPTPTSALGSNIISRAAKGGLLKEFPSDLVVSDDAVILDSVEAKSPDKPKSVYTTFYETELSLTKIKQAYEAYFKKSDWKVISNNLTSDQLNMFAVEEPTGQQVEITVVDLPNKMRRLVQIELRKPKI